MHESFEGKLDEVIKRAHEAEVIAIINNGTDPETNRKTIALSAKW